MPGSRRLARSMPGSRRLARSMAGSRRLTIRSVLIAITCTAFGNLCRSNTPETLLVTICFRPIGAKDASHVTTCVILILVCEI